MVFELIRKNRAGQDRIEPDTIRICKGCLTFGRYAHEFLNKPYVQIYVDKDNNKIGFKPADNPLTGFKISNKDGAKRLSNNKFLGTLPDANYVMSIEEGIIVINISEIPDYPTVLD